MHGHILKLFESSKHLLVHLNTALYCKSEHGKEQLKPFIRPQLSITKLCVEVCSLKPDKNVSG